MRIVAHRGNRLHAPENTRVALLSAYTAGADLLELDVQLSKDGKLVVSHDATLERLSGDARAIADTPFADLRKLDVSATFRPRGAADAYRYKAQGRRRIEVESFPGLLDTLPAGVQKLIEIKHDSTMTGRRDEVVRKTVAALADRHELDNVILYSKDPEVLRAARVLAAQLRVCVFDWDLEPAEQLALIGDVGADGIVIDLGLLLGPDGAPTQIARDLEKLHAERSLSVGAVVYLFRQPRVFTREEHDALRKLPFVFSVATDSMLDVAPYVRHAMTFVDEPFEGKEINTGRIAFGYAKANHYAHVYQDDGVHVDIGPYHAPAARTEESALDRRLREIEERLWYAEGSWPFYSGGGFGLVQGIDGDFAAEVSYEVSRVGEASTLEMAVVNANPGAHMPPWNEDGTPRLPRSFRDKDVFFDPHGAPPFAGVEHDEADGYRINWNLGTQYDNNGYGSPVGDGTALAGRLRLERRGPFFTAYYRNGDCPDWVAVGAIRNDSLNQRVFLRCAGKRWRQERDDDPSQYHPVVPVKFTFRDFVVTRF